MYYRIALFFIVPALCLLDNLAFFRAKILISKENYLYWERKKKKSFKFRTGFCNSFVCVCVCVCVSVW